MTARPKAYVSWSSGKDSAFALLEAQRLGLADIVGVLTTVNETYQRVAMHGVRNALLDRQVAALGLPAITVPIPYPCSNDLYNARIGAVFSSLQAQGIGHIVFGDLFLADIRAYRESMMAPLGMTPLFPLWQRDTMELANDVIDAGIEAHLACIDPATLDRSFAGRRFDRELLKDLPAHVDPCGENGEFHTVVTAGPMFSAKIEIERGEVVERDGFVFADFLPR